MQQLITNSCQHGEVEAILGCILEYDVPVPVRYLVKSDGPLESPTRS